MDTNHILHSKIPSILVVDDDRAVRLLMCKQLESFGCEVDQAEDGLAAVRQVENNNRYCLIFMDIEMPRLNGLQAAAAIRCHEEHLGLELTPIIAATSGGATRELCLAVGMSDYLSKPVDMEKIQVVLEKWKCSSNCAELAI